MRRLIGTGLVIAAGASAPAGAQIPLRSIGVLPPPFNSSDVKGVSADGSVVYGLCAQPAPAGTVVPVIWTGTAGLESLGSLGGNYGATGAASDDGSVIVGASAGASGYLRAFRWTRAAGMQDLGVLPGALSSESAGVSADGSAVCGTAYSNPNITTAWRWTVSGGMEPIASGLFGVGVSADGSTALCRGGMSGALWTRAGGVQVLPDSPINWLPGATPFWLSPDGATVIGTIYLPGHDFSTLYRWTDGAGYETLPPGPIQVQHWLKVVSPDGSLVVTNNDFGGHGPFVVIGSTVWDAWEYLRLRGADLSGWTSLWITGVSRDLRTFVGHGFARSGRMEGWVATLPLCYANCDDSTAPPVLNINDFVCFQRRYAAGDPLANCDGSTAPPVLNVNDFVCFQERFAAGCP